MKKSLIITFFLLLASMISHAQDFIRLGLGGDFQKSKFIQTFTFDLNRTEQVNEKNGRYFLFSNNGIFLLPSIDVNIGEKVTASENNILIQLTMGKAFLPTPHTAGKLTKLVWNKSIEFNPSYNADKNFAEKLGYTQVKFTVNPLWAKFYPSNNFRSETSLSLGLFTNNGYRHSATFDKDHGYSTGGVIIGFKERFRNDGQMADDVVLSASGNYYRIFSELNDLMNKKEAGALKISVDKLIGKIYYLGLIYKYGNDNPTYHTISTLEASFKIKY